VAHPKPSSRLLLQRKKARKAHLLLDWAAIGGVEWCVKGDWRVIDTHFWSHANCCSTILYSRKEARIVRMTKPLSNPNAALT
jgi:hypothetical protein